MRKDVTFLLCLNEDSWRILRLLDGAVEERFLPRNDIVPEESQYEKLAELFKELGYADEEICLGLPASRVFSAMIETAGLPRKNRATSLLYRLEEQLPLEAERLTADFLEIGNDAALGFAVITRDLQSILDVLAAKRIEVSAICPTALLQLWDVFQAGSGEFDYIAIQDHSSVQLFRMEKGRPCAWFPLPAETNALADRLAADGLARPVSDGIPTLLLVGRFPESTEPEIQQKVSIEIQRNEEYSSPPGLVQTAGDVLVGKNAGWVDFRRDGLAMPNTWQRQAGLLRLAAVLGLGFLVVLSGLFYFRSHGYEDSARKNQRQLDVVYGNLFPGRRVPVNVKKALTSEFRRLSGTRGSEQGIPEQSCALETLRKIVASLPPAIRLRVLDIRIGPGGVLIEGQARDHTAAETLAKSLKANGFDVDSPRTETLSQGGVSFTLDVKYSSQNASGIAMGGNT